MIRFFLKKDAANVISLECKISAIWLPETVCIFDIFNCYSANISGMFDARKLSGI